MSRLLSFWETTKPHFLTKLTQKTTKEMKNKAALYLYRRQRKQNNKSDVQ